MHTDPVLYESEKNKRHVFFPVRYDKIYELYKKQVDSFWRAEEIILTEDLQHWRTKLTEDEKKFVLQVLAFFAASDGIVMENIAARFLEEVKLPEARAFYSFQIAMEQIHSETYSLLIDALAGESKEKIFRAVDNFPAIQMKAVWAEKHMNHFMPFSRRLLAFACVEGIFFSGAFCAIYWLKKRGLMPGLTFSNELISRDEALHTEMAVELYHTLSKEEKDKTSESQIKRLFEEAVIIEKLFIVESLPCKLVGMNSNLMSQYIEFVCDRLLLQLGFSKMFGTSNPFDFMELISIENKANFFERTVSSYALANKHISKDCFDDI